MLTYVINYNSGVGKFKTNNFSNLCKVLEANFSIVNSVEIRKDEKELIVQFKSEAYSDEPMHMLEHELLEKSINEMVGCDKVDVFVEDIFIGKSQNIMEAKFDINGAKLNTEDVEWPMEMPMLLTYVYCAFRYITGIRTNIEAPKF